MSEKRSTYLHSLLSLFFALVIMAPMVFVGGHHRHAVILKQSTENQSISKEIADEDGTSNELFASAESNTSSDEQEPKKSNKKEYYFISSAHEATLLATQIPVPAPMVWVQENFTLTSFSIVSIILRTAGPEGRPTFIERLYNTSIRSLGP